MGGEKFAGSSSYGADYSSKGVPLRADRVPLPKNHVLPEGRFEGDSLYHASFIPGKSEKLKQYKPEGELKIGGSFTG